MMSISDGLDPYNFLSKDGKNAVCERRDERTCVYFPPESIILLLQIIWLKYCFPICTLNWRANKYNSRQEKSNNRRREGTFNTIYKLLPFGVVLKIS